MYRLAVPRHLSSHSRALCRRFPPSPYRVGRFPVTRVLSSPSTVVHPGLRGRGGFIPFTETLKSSSPWRRRMVSSTPWVGMVLLGCAWQLVSPISPDKLLHCESPQTMAVEETNSNLQIKWKNPKTKRGETNLLDDLSRGLRILRRLLKLLLAFTPIAVLYPVHYLLTSSAPQNSEESSEMDAKKMDAHEVALKSLREGGETLLQGASSSEWYYKLCLRCVEFSGAAAIKIMQWAGSRPDMFGQDFCSIFSQLQDDTKPHCWEHTERVLRDAYGNNWKEHVELNEILGSGCIAQVYKGVITDDNGQQQPVAVKVMHPNVEEDIAADLDIMRISSYLIEKAPFEFAKKLKWLNLPGIAEEMATLLQVQLDLRTEADHLERFNENFKDDKVLVFPKLVEGYKPSKNILIETFMEGDSISEFIRKNADNKPLLTKMCKSGVRAVSQMIFLDNFIHGDLHPGNVMVSNDEHIIFLDVGIVVENSKSDHRLLGDVLTAFIRKQGRLAGRHMIEDSNNRLRDQGDHSLDEECFLDKIESLTIQASTKGYLMERLGTYISFICEAAATHHVMLNQAFVSAALAVKVQEGMVLALDPSVSIPKLAIPIILEGERRHGLVAERAKEVLGVKGIFDNFPKPSFLSKQPTRND